MRTIVRHRPLPPTTAPRAASCAAFARRLRALVVKTGSVSALARATGTSGGAIHKWLKAQSEPSRDRLVALARAAKVSVRWLATGEGAQEEGLPEGYAIPACGCAEVAAKYGAKLGIGQTVTTLAFKREWLERRLGLEPCAVLLVEAMGDAMAPTIEEGNLVLVDISEPPFKDDGVYVIVRDERLCVRRVSRRLDGTIVASTDNPAYSAETVQADSIKPVGRVVWRGGRI